MRPRSAVPGAPAAPDLAEIGEAEWEQARRRAAAIRPLAEVPRNSRARVEQVAAELGCKPALVYRLVARWRADPRVTSLLPSTRGRRPGAFRKAPEIDELVRVAIEEVYLTRQKPTVSHLVGRCVGGASMPGCNHQAEAPSSAALHSERPPKSSHAARAARLHATASRRRPDRSRPHGRFRLCRSIIRWSTSSSWTR